MSTNIDERVVKMEFDESGFTAGAEKAIGILDKLKDALNLNGASAGLNDVQKAASQFNMDGVSDALENSKSGFSAFETFATGVFLNLGKRVSDFALNKLSQIPQVLTKGITDGFGEYQMQMGSIQTILSNTRDAFNEAGITDEGAQIDIINDRLNELNKYADDTIYNFSQMTKNIGLFTAAGVDLDTSVTAIKGLSNLAAVSGADANNASRAMYQMSQAMSTGVVKLMDWNSLVNAGMGGKLFQDEIKRVAENHGIAVDQIIAKQGSFRESLSEGWLTADIFNEALQHLTYTYKDEGDAAWEAGMAELKAAGYSDEAARSIMELGKNATEAATKVRTWSQLWDTVGEAIGSGWAQTWQIIVGDFLEATELFTWFSDRISAVVGASADARNKVLEAWAEAGGRKALVDTLRNLYLMVEKPLKAIATAFSNVFGISSFELYNITTAIGAFVQSLVMSDEAAQFFEYVMTDVFAVLHSIIGVVGNVIRVIVGIGEVTWNIVSPALQVLAVGFGLIMDPIAKATHVILAITDVIQHFIQKGLDFLVVNIQKAFAAVDEFFGGILETAGPALDLLADFGRRVGRIALAIYNALMKDTGLTGFQSVAKLVAYHCGVMADKLVELGPIGEAIGEIFLALGAVFHEISRWLDLIADKTNGAVKPLFDYIAPELQVLGQTIYDALPAPLQFAVDFISDSFNQIKDAIVDFVSKSELIQGAIAAFQSFKDTISGMFNSKISLGDGFSSMIDTLKNGAIDVFWKLPKPIQMVVGAIGLLAKTFYTTAKNFVTGTTLFKNLSKVFDDFASGKETLTFMNVLTRVKDAIKESLKSMVATLQDSPIGRLFDKLTEKFKNFGSGLLEAVPGLGKAKDALVNLWQTGDTSAFDLGAIFGDLPGTFKSLFEMILQTLSYFKDNIVEEASELDISNIKETFSGITSLPDILSPVATGVESASGDVSAAMSGLLNIFNPENFQDLGDTIHGILDLGLIASLSAWVKSLSKVNNSVADVAKGIANWPKNMGDMFARIGEGFHKETKMDQMLKLAGAIAILAGSLFLVASIPAGDLERAGKTIAIMTGVMIGIIAMMDAVAKKFTGMFDAGRMKALGDSIKGMGIGILALAVACFVISRLDDEQFSNAIIKVGVISVALALLSAAIGQNGKSIRSGALGMVIMAGAVYAMGKAVEAIGNLDKDALDNGVTYFVAIMAMMTLFGKFGAEGIGKLLSSFLKFGVGLIAIGIGLAVIANAISAMDQHLSEIKNLPLTLGVLVGAIVAFGVLAKIVDGANAVKVATAFTIFGAALLVMATSFSIMKEFAGNAGDIVVAGAVFAAFVGLFIGLIAVSKSMDPKQVLMTAASMVVFASSTLILSGAIAALAYVLNTDGDSAGKAFVMLAAFLAAFLGISQVLAPKAGEVMLVAQALVVFSASLIVFAAGVWAMSQVNIAEAAGGLAVFGGALLALTLIATFLGPATVFMMAAAKAMLILGAAILVFAAGIWVLAQAITSLEGLDAATIADRLGAVGTGIAQMAWNMISTFFGNIAQAFTEHSDEIVQGAQDMLGSARDTVVEHIPDIMDALGGIALELSGFFGEIGAWLDEHGPELFDQAVTFIQENIPNIIEAIHGIVDGIAQALGPLAETAITAAQEWFGNLITYLNSPEGQAEVSARAQEIGGMLLEGLGMVIDGLGDLVGNIWTAFTGWLNETFSGLLDEGADIAQGLLDGIINGITGAPDAILGAMQELGGNILNGIRDFLGIHSPSTEMQTVGENVVEGLINGINGFFGGLGEAALGLGETILNGVVSLPGTILETGGQVVGGLIDGIGSGVGDLAQGAADLAGAVVGGVQDLGANLLGIGQESSSSLSQGLNQGSPEAAAAMQSLANQLQVSADQIAAMMTTAGMNAIQAFVQAFVAGGASIGGAFASINAQVMAMIAPMIASLQTAGQTAMQGFAVGFTSGSTTVVSIIVRLAQQIIAACTNIVKAMQTAGKTAANGFAVGFASGVSSATKAVTAMSTAIIKTASNLVTQMEKAGQTAANGFASGLSAGSGAVSKSMANIAKSANGYSSPMYNKFHQIGSYAVQGFTNGINSKIGSAERAVTKLATLVTKAAKLTLKEKSPSRVFKEIGQFVSEGLAIGISQNAKLAVNATSDMAEAIPSTFTDTLSNLSLSIDDILDTDYNPVITPVINSAEFDSSMNRLSAMMSGGLQGGLNIGDLNYNETFAAKLDGLIDSNRQAMQEFAESAIDYNKLGVSVANALIQSGLHVEMEGGQLMGYLAGQINDARRMYGR